MLVDLGGGRTGSVCVTHAADRSDWAENPFAEYKAGDVVTAVVLHGGKHVQLSLRPSLVEAAEEGDGLSAKELKARLAKEAAKVVKEDTVVQAYVGSTGGKGCFLRLAHKVIARALIKNLSVCVCVQRCGRGDYTELTLCCCCVALLQDKFVRNVVAYFPPGRLVQARVLSHDTESGRTEVTLK